MNKEVMASAVAAGLLLLAGLGIIVGSSISVDSGGSDVYDGGNISAALSSMQGSLANGSGNDSAPETLDQVLDQEDKAQATDAIDNQTAGNSPNETANTTSTSVLDTTSGDGGTSSGGSHHSSSSSSRKTSAEGMLHYNDCISTYSSKVCLMDLSLDSPHSAILSVEKSSGADVATVVMEPYSSLAVPFGNGNGVIVSVEDTSVSGSSILASVSITDSSSVEGMVLEYGDCISASNSKACLSDISADGDSAIFSVYGSDGKLINSIGVEQGESGSVALGSGKEALITVFDINPGASANVIASANEISVASKGSILHLDDCISTRYSKVCLEDISAGSPSSAIVRIYNSSKKLVSTEEVQKGDSETFRVSYGKGVLVTVSSVTLLNGSSSWAMVSAKDVSMDEPYEAELSMGECASGPKAKVCLEDMGTESPYPAILGIYTTSNSLVSIKTISPGDSSTVKVGSSNVLVEVTMTAFDPAHDSYQAHIRIK